MCACSPHIQGKPRRRCGLKEPVTDVRYRSILSQLLAKGNDKADITNELLKQVIDQLKNQFKNSKGAKADRMLHSKSAPSRATFILRFL